MRYFCPYCNSSSIISVEEDDKHKWYCIHCDTFFETAEIRRFKICINSEVLKRLIDDVPYCGDLVSINNNESIRDEDREYVLERENYKCKVCNQGGRAIHHIIPRPYGNNDINNLVLLCTKCHRFVHWHLFEKGYGKDRGSIVIYEEKSENLNARKVLVEEDEMERVRKLQFNHSKLQESIEEAFGSR